MIVKIKGKRKRKGTKELRENEKEEAVKEKFNGMR